MIWQLDYSDPLVPPHSDHIDSHGWTEDETGAPDGGQSYGPGFTIAWQRGPVRGPAGDSGQNGAYLTDVVDACIDKLWQYQSGPFASQENADALLHLRLARHHLQRRIERRLNAGVAGTHEVMPDEAGYEERNIDFPVD